MGFDHLDLPDTKTEESEGNNNPGTYFIKFFTAR